MFDTDGLMIQNRERAVAVAQAAEALIRELGLTLRSAQATDPFEAEKLKRAIGLVIGKLEIELLSPLYTRHPDLEPDGLKGWAGGGMSSDTSDPR